MDASPRAVSPLRQRMIEDMRLRQLNPKTQSAYLRSVSNFARYLGRSPATATIEDLRRFLLHVLPRGFHRIRHVGLFANARRKDNLARLRELLQATPAAPVITPDPAETSSRPAPPTFVCPCCGAPMIVLVSFGRGQPIRAPPSARGAP